MGIGEGYGRHLERLNMGGGPGFFVTMYIGRNSGRIVGIADFQVEDIGPNMNLNYLNFVFEIDLNVYCDLIQGLKLV